jgi:hypothetical protein
VSTRSSIWLGEDEGKSVHIYFELSDRDVATGAAPVCIAVDEGDSNQEIVVRLPKQVAEKLLRVLQPSPGWKVL